jgi:hypothetical protein
MPVSQGSDKPNDGLWMVRARDAPPAAIPENRFGAEGDFAS